MLKVIIIFYKFKNSFNIICGAGKIKVFINFVKNNNSQAKITKMLKVITFKKLFFSDISQ
jgi:hypothetical protein